MTFPDRPLRRAEASTYLKDTHGIERTPATLAKYATVGGGPEFRKAGRVPIYTTLALDVYAAEITSPAVRSTSELRALAAPPRASHKPARPTPRQ